METKRRNGGYEIIESVPVNVPGITEYVLGTRETELGREYATWGCGENADYFWGHYFDDYYAARRDLLLRALREQEWWGGGEINCVFMNQPSKGK